MTTSVYSLIAVVASVAFILLANYVVNRRRETHKWSFLVADRRAGWIRTAFSIAAAWVWAPAFFVSAQQAYQNGWVGVFWFTIPNILCLILFSFFAHKIRNQHPKGVTLSEYMCGKYGAGVQKMYAFCLILLSLMSFAVQLLAGGMVISYLSGIEYGLATVLLATVAVIYSHRSGLKASFVTGVIKTLVIVAVGVGSAYFVALNSGSFVSGLRGVGGDIESLFSGSGGAVFWSFGLSALIGIISGPFADQAFWQRAFAVEKRSVRKSFIVGALLYAITPLTMSVLGFAVAGSGIYVDNVQLVNIIAIDTWLPDWFMGFFVAMITIGLLSTLDASMSAVSSIIGNDFSKPHRSIRNARASIIILAILGIGVANIPGLTIVGLFIIYGTLRSVSFIPTVLTIGTSMKLSGRGVLLGMASSLLIGLPISAYGNMSGNTVFIVSGSVVTVLVSGIVTVLVSRISRHKYLNQVQQV